MAKEALDTLLQGEVTPWAQQGSQMPVPLPKKKTDHEWAVAGGFPNLEEEYNRCIAWNIAFELQCRFGCKAYRYCMQLRNLQLGI